MTQFDKNRWIFDLNRLQNTPSKRDGIGSHEELLLRQKGTNLIKDMSQELKLRPIVTNTAIVYFHRFFTLRSFKRFDVNRISVCCLFLSAKWEEQPIFKEHIIKLSFHCRRKQLTEEIYQKECERLVENENEMLLTFGFDLSVTHFQTVICSASDPTVINKTIQRNAYIIAGDLLRLSTICVEFPPTFAACLCIYLSSSLLDLPIKDENWSQTIDKEVQLSDVEREAQKFKCFINPSRLSIEEKKRKLNPSTSPESAYSSGSGNSPVFDFLPTSQTKPTNNNKTNKNSNHLNQMVANNCNNKRNVSEQSSSSLGKTCDRLKPSTNSLTNSQNFKTKVLPNNRCVLKRDGTSVRNNDSIINRVKYQKVVKPNGEVARVAVPPKTNTSAQVAISSVSEMSKHMNNSSLIKHKSLTTSSIGTNGNTLSKGIKKLNFKITFSTTNDSNTSESIKRNVRTTSQQILKIES